MATKREKLIDILGSKYPNMFLRITEQFNGSKGGIWTFGEDNLLTKDGKSLFDYYADGDKYELGVHKEIGDLLLKHGWYAEWYDCETIMLWEI